MEYKSQPPNTELTSESVRRVLESVSASYIYIDSRRILEESRTEKELAQFFDHLKGKEIFSEIFMAETGLTDHIERVETTGLPNKYRIVAAGQVFETSLIPVFNSNEYAGVFVVFNKITGLRSFIANPGSIKPFLQYYDLVLLLGTDLRIISKAVSPEFTAGSLFNLDSDNIESFFLYFKFRDEIKKSVLSDNPRNFMIGFEYQGENKFFRGYFYPVSGEDGAACFVGLKDISSQISEKMHLEEYLSLFKSIFDFSKDGIAVESERKYFLVNKAFSDMFGFENTDEMTGIDPIDLVANEDIVRIAGYIRALERGDESPSVYEFKAKKKNGKELFVQKSVAVYNLENRRILISVFRDITVSKITETALRESEEKYREIVANIDEFLWTAKKKNNRVTADFYSPTVKHYTGYDSAAFLKDSRLWLKIIHHEDQPAVIKQMKKFYADKKKNSLRIEYRIFQSNGSSIWIENHINVKRDENGKINKIFGIVGDISLRKKAEEEMEKTAVELKSVNAAKDKFISIISHDLRTPFSSVLGFTDIILNDPEIEPETSRQYIGFIRESATNMLSMVNSLLDWTRLQTGRMNYEPSDISAYAVVSQVTEMLKGAAIQKDISLKNEVSPSINIYADKNLIIQLFNNLVSNAIKFTPRGGMVSISCKPDPAGDKLQFEVRDSGIGIPADVIDKLFRVDSKTTTAGTEGERGSGLGLKICKEIVVMHGGNIHVESTEGKGTSFNFTLPASPNKILFVDDSKPDRILYTKLMKSFDGNYKILEASSVEQAADVFEKERPALVLTDHKLIDKTGLQLVEILNSDKYEIKPSIIVLSGYISAEDIKSYEEAGIKYTFRKPVNVRELKKAIEVSLHMNLKGSQK